MVKSEECMISVILTTYNSGLNLKYSIDSIVNQSIGLENIELIIVDDGSTDNTTHQIIKDYHKKYPRNIKPIFLDKNSGFPGKPRNIGLQHVSSDYVIFSDDDDIYCDNAFNILYNNIIKYDSDVVICNAYVNVEGYKFPMIFDLNKDIVNMNPLSNQENFDIMTNKINTGLWARIYKKNIILENKLKFIEYTNFEDANFSLELLKYLNKITILPHNLIYVYNIREDSSIHKHNLKLFNGMIKGAYDICNTIKEFKFNIDIILINFISTILLVFSQLKNDEKEESILKLFKLEKYVDENFNFNFNLKRKELNILNNAILKKSFQKAILISHIYKKLYNNKHIQKIYKKYRSNNFNLKN